MELSETSKAPQFAGMYIWGTKWNLSWTSDYQITDLSPVLPGTGQHLPLFPTDKECVTDRSILQLTKQLAKNRTDNTQRWVWRQWNQSAFSKTSFLSFPMQQVGGLSLFIIVLLIYFVLSTFSFIFQYTRFLKMAHSHVKKKENTHPANDIQAGWFLMNEGVLK